MIMKAFADMFRQVDQTTKTSEKVSALVEFFTLAPEEDKVWAIALFTGRRPRRTVKTSLLREWAAVEAGIPDWLFEESYHVVGDLAETIALLLPPPKLSSANQSLAQWIHYIYALKGATQEYVQGQIIKAWQSLPIDQRLIFNKLITGGWRIGVSQKLLTKALSIYLSTDENTIAHRLMGDWSPFEISFDRLLIQDHEGDYLSKPYPFYLAYALDVGFDHLDGPESWIAERKWDGIRGQLIKRNGKIYLWSRGEELITDKFPEFKVIQNSPEDHFVLDGEIMPFKNGPLSFNQLQTRIGRKNISKRVLTDTPVKLIAYDLLEYNGEDVRHLPLRVRRAMLEQLYHSSLAKTEVILLSEILAFDDWETLAAIRDTSREHISEGVMLKHKDSSYQVGRKRGHWWKWKVDPMTIDAVMIYAQSGHGRRANLFSDYTFAVWDGDLLVPFAKAYSGLTDKEFQEVTNWCRRHIVQKFGPVLSVEPVLVFELAFEGISTSSRHKSGIAVRFPRILRWRKDKPAREANTLDDLKALLHTG